MKERPSLRQLEYLIAVDELLNFREAAEACFVTQPALSTQIQQLEERLGVQLFERDKKRVLSTPAGRELAARAREVLERVDELVDLAAAKRPPLTGEISLGVIPTVGPYLLPRLLGPLRQRHPELTLWLREDTTPNLVEAAAQGRLDVLLLALEADLSDLHTETLFSDPFLVALPAKHALAGREELTECDLEGETLLLLEEGHCLRDQALAACESFGPQEGAYRGTSLGTLVQMVAGGLGITLVPEVAAPLESRAGGLVLRPLSSDSAARTIVLAWRATSARSEEFRLLARSLSEVYAST